jgi:hypothetical protein
MACNEDFFYNVYLEIREKGVSEDFYKQLDKMKFQDHHKYKTVRQTWEYAYDKIVIPSVKNKIVLNETH